MVAYSFAPQFHLAVATGEKRQTVRAHRRRHARRGEPIQLYAGMRTRHCRKLLDPDPVCCAVLPIEIVINRQIDDLIASIEIADLPLDRREIENFALDDGFSAGATTARRAMGQFWLDHHGEGRFEGVLIKWQLPFQW